GDEELFEWKYDYPGTAADDHHLYVETDSTVTAFARLYHRTLFAGADRYDVVVRGNAAVHPDYRQMGQYTALHEATKRHCESTGADMVMTFNRKDNYSFETSAKNDWSHAELPLYLNILNPSAALEEYARGVLEPNETLRRVASLLGNRVRLSVAGDSVSLASLVDDSVADTRGVTVHLSRDALDELVELVADGAGIRTLVGRGASLVARGEVSPFPVHETAPEAPSNDVDVIPRGAFVPSERAAIRRLYDTVFDGTTPEGRFRREAVDVEHMLSHPHHLGTLWLERDDDLAGFATVYTVRSGDVLEGRVADLVAVDGSARATLVDALESVCRNNGLDVIAMFSPVVPDDRWVRIRRHVLMWNELSSEAGGFSPPAWTLGFYDVV
ncbi:MAG: hypothetical protein ACOCSN_02645, partial [Halanaeroarchaeum sp.]